MATCNQLSAQRQAGLERNTGSVSPGTMVHVMHVQFAFFSVFENSKALFS